MIIKLRSEPAGPEHIHESVFIGTDADHLQLAGRLVLDVAQWQRFGVLLQLGAAEAPALGVQVILEGDQVIVEALS